MKPLLYLFYCLLFGNKKTRAFVNFGATGMAYAIQTNEEIALFRHISNYLEEIVERQYKNVV